MKLCNNTLKTYKLLINSHNETSHVPIYNLLYLQNDCESGKPASAQPMASISTKSRDLFLIDTPSTVAAHK